MDFKREFVDKLATRVAEKLNFMQVVVGPRQVGKTTGVTQVLEGFSGNKLLATADLPAPPQSEWIIAHWNRARELYGEVMLVFDEIQKIPRWSETIKSLFDADRKERRLRVVLLGSASLTLGLGLNETLAGRFEKIDVPHWTFPECKKLFSWDLEDYLVFGGYPAPAEFLPDIERWQKFLRDSIIEPVVSKDIFGLASIRKPALFRQTLELAMSFPAQEISYQKLLGQLQDKSNVTTIRHYLEIMQEAFILHLLPKYSASVIREKNTTPKIVPMCPALVHAFLDPNKTLNDPIIQGRMLELVVGAYLIRKYPKVYYWRERDFEVDYVVPKDGKLFAIEVKSQRFRKQNGINAFLKVYPKAVPIVINRDNVEQLFLGEVF